MILSVGFKEQHIKRNEFIILQQWMKRTVLMGERNIIRIAKSYKIEMNLGCLRFDEVYKV